MHSVEKLILKGTMTSYIPSQLVSKLCDSKLSNHVSQFICQKTPKERKLGATHLKLDFQPSFSQTI